MSTDTPAPRPRRAASPRTHLALDWVAGHGPVSAPVAMATTAAAAATVGALANMPPGIPLGVGVVGAAAHGIGQGIRRGLSRPSLWVRATGWLLAGGWSSAAIAAHPGTWPAAGWWEAIGALAAVAIGVGSGLHRADVHEEALDEERRARDEALRAAELDRADWALVDRWVELIRVVARVTVQPLALAQRPDGSGFGLEVGLPVAFTAARFQEYATALAEAARLPQGCLVHISPAAAQGTVILDVDTVVATAVARPYPGDYSPLTINGGIPWGISRLGEEIYVHLREACALVLGPPGTGKTTLLDSVLTGFVRCDDVLVWGVDLGKQGDAFVPWLSAWQEGQRMIPPPHGVSRLPETTRPGVDWVAATEAETESMLDAALAIGAARLIAYRELMRKENTKLLPISRAVPMIFVIIDEGAELLAYTGLDPRRKRLKEKTLEVMRTLRAMGIRLILTATDGNISTLGDTAIRKYSPVSVALTSTDAAGAGVVKLFGSVAGLDPRQLTAKGTGVIGARTEPGFSPQPFRTYFTQPSLARDACAATNSRRPELDKASADAAGAAYAHRWDREKLGWLVESDDMPAPPISKSPEESRRTGLNLRIRPAQPISPEDQDAALSAFLGQLEKLPETTEPPVRRTPPPLNLNIRRSEEGTADNPSWKDAAMEVLRAAGDSWMGTSEIREKLAERKVEIGRSALSTVLAEWARRGEIRKRGTGPQTVYGAPE